MQVQLQAPATRLRAGLEKGSITWHTITPQNATRPFCGRMEQRCRNRRLKHLVPRIDGPSFESLDSEDYLSPVLTLVGLPEQGLIQLYVSET